VPLLCAYNPYRYLSRGFARAVAAGKLHLYCEFCVHAGPSGCKAGEDPACWAQRECPAYLEAEEAG
jgi:hypothetical protein